MVGGMATLAALTGTGAGLSTAGLNLERSRDVAQQFAAFRFRAAEGMAHGSSTELRTSVAGILAVVAMQEKCGFQSSAAILEDVLLQTLSIVTAGYRLHEEVAPARPGTRDWKAKEKMLRTALDWLEPRVDSDGDRGSVRKAIA